MAGKAHENWWAGNELVQNLLERVLQVINRPSREEAGATAFAWIDTKEVRAPDSRAYALLNDSERAVSPSVMDSLQSYDVRPVPWSRRQTVVEELRA